MSRRPPPSGDAPAPGDGAAAAAVCQGRSAPAAAEQATGADASFDANALALEPGLRLLEASAGTGKTFALAHLVLRLVSEAGLRLGQILVVTFTEAAAAELRDRIGRRLQAGLAALEDADPSGGDPVLQGWHRRCQDLPDPDRERLRIQLLLALEELAAADITTIHGFCRRTLVREALPAGRSPQLQLEDGDDPGVAEVVHGYWHRQVLPLPLHLLEGLRRCRVDPALLEDLLRQLDGDPALSLDPLPDGLSLERGLPEALPELWEKHWHGFLAHWQRSGRGLQQDLQAEAQRWKEQGLGKTDPYRPSARSDRCAELDSWIAAQPPEGHYGATLAQKLLCDYYHPGTFSRVARRAERDPEQAVRLPQAALMEAVASLVDGPAEMVVLHALHHCRRELALRRHRRGLSSFSQLLADLDPGPDPHLPSPLLQAVGARYRAALIDEFQDTDPIQWRILRRAFGQGQHLLVMVGDPKQAIYRFRGGDLRTYLEAAGQAQERHALNENRRSTPELITALNRLMAPGLRRSDLRVPEVQARSSRRGPQGTPIEVLWLAPQRPGKDESPDATAGEDSSLVLEGPSVRHPSRTDLERRLPTLVARHLLDLLGRQLRLTDDGSRRPLAAADICLLVGNHRQAEALRVALERHGIASRLVSRADVFSSPAATGLQRLLDALADPCDDNRLRLLAATPLLDWGPARIASAPASAWADLAGRLAAMAQELGRRGLLGVLADLLGAEGTARLALGGRLAADLQQVSELVQQRLHADQLSAAAAADWLRRHRLDPQRRVPEAHQAHSDRADGAVSVITIHRSKGLEFPVVICPYLWQASSPAGRQGIGRRWHPPGGSAPVLDLHRNLHWGAGFAAERQRLLAEESERERLAYVALTRAQHLLVLAWGPAQGQHCSPLMPWLFAQTGLPDPEEDRLALAPAATWRQWLEEEILRRALPITLVDGESLPPGRAAAAAPDRGQPLGTGRVPARRLERSWGRSSYSSWVHGATSAADAPLEALEEGRDTGDATPTPLLESGGAEPGEPPGPGGDGGDGGSNPARDWAEQGPLTAFPRGPAAGDCLHRILEQLDYSQPLRGEGSRELIGRELRRAGLEAPLLPAVQEGLELVRTTPFGGELGDRRLADLAPGRWLNEMRFDLTLDFAAAPALAAAFANWPEGLFGAAYGQELARLPIASRGFLTGSIDLLFPLASGSGEERWWVLDWKSNWLGRRDREGTAVACGPRHYGQAEMARLMAASHYPLQAHLYLVALHRYLRWRLPAYDPARHLGGYVYAFLRGAPGEAGVQALPGPVPGMVVERPPLGRLLALDGALGCSHAEGWDGREAAP